MSALPAGEADARPFGPGDLHWEWTGDVRSLLTMPGMLVLQSFHPTVAAGIGEHSLFESDPWGRRQMAVSSALVRVYGGRAAVAEAAKLRTQHKAFVGKDRDGRRYSALNPDAFAFVHHTAYLWIVRTAQDFGRPFTPEQQRQAYAEHLRAGRILSLRERDLPPTVEDFWRYWEHTVQTGLVDHPSIHRLFGSLADPLPPPGLPARLRPAWPVVGSRLGRVGSLMIRAFLPAAAREVANIAWTSTDARNYDRLRRSVRAVVERLPPERRYVAAARTARLEASAAG